MKYVKTRKKSWNIDLFPHSTYIIRNLKYHNGEVLFYKFFSSFLKVMVKLSLFLAVCF